MYKSEYVSKVEQLVGCQLTGVRYHEILYQDENEVPHGKPEWNWSQDFDSLDYGLDLEFTDGSMCHITWGNEFHPYGVSLQFKQPEYAAPIQIWNIGGENRWAPLLNQQIIKTDVYWENLIGENITIDYPQSIQIIFESGAAVWISALEIENDGTYMGIKDHVTVFFDKAVAEKYSAWPSRWQKASDLNHSNRAG